MVKTMEKQDFGPKSCWNSGFHKHQHTKLMFAYKKSAFSLILEAAYLCSMVELFMLNG